MSTPLFFCWFWFIYIYVLFVFLNHKALVIERLQYLLLSTRRHWCFTQTASSPCPRVSSFAVRKFYKRGVMYTHSPWVNVIKAVTFRQSHPSSEWSISAWPEWMMRWQRNTRWVLVSSLQAADVWKTQTNQFADKVKLNEWTVQWNAVVCLLSHFQGLQSYAACQSHAFMKGTGTFVLGEECVVK